MLRITLVFALVIFVGLSCEVYAQDAGSRARELAMALDKSKHKKKEKNNITVEVYVDIKNEVALRDASDYGGNYESEGSDYRLTLQVERGGAVSGSGQDSFNDRRMAFTLKDARIDGAVLTGTKVYDNGETRKLEAVFVNRTAASGKNPNEIASRDTKFGLGFVDKGNWSDGSNHMNWTSRVFLVRR